MAADMDQELQLIESLLSVLKSARVNTDLGPVEIARAVAYVAERVEAERDEYEQELAEEDDQIFANADPLAALAKIQHFLRREAAEASGCDCPDCQRLRGERYDA